MRATLLSNKSDLLSETSSLSSTSVFLVSFNSSISPLTLIFQFPNSITDSFAFLQFSISVLRAFSRSVNAFWSTVKSISHADVLKNSTTSEADELAQQARRIAISMCLLGGRAEEIEDQRAVIKAFNQPDAMDLNTCTQQPNDAEKEEEDDKENGGQWNVMD
nr:hypothetical protein Iba_chr06fCG7240 [Ipomoea batatas]